MFGKQHGTHGNNQDKCTEEYSCFVITQQARVLFTANKSVHHEYAIINPYTKDKCGDDNVDEIEPYIKNHHCPQHYKPARQDWHKTEQGMLDIEMETEEEYDEYKEHGNPLQHIEVVIQLDQCICGIIIGVEHKQAR